MIGPVEFHAARDPGAERADQRGLDDMLAVEKVITGGFVHGGKDPAAKLG